MLTFALKKKRTPSIAPKRPAPAVSPMSHSLPLQQAGVRHILRGPTLQPKLTIGAPNDKYEQEADRIADEVMRTPEPGVQRQVEPEEEEEETLQPKPLVSQITPLVQVQRQEEPEEEEKTLQAKPLADQITPLVQRQVEPEEEEEELLQAKLVDDTQVQRQEEEEEEPVQTKRASGKTAFVGQKPASQVSSLRGSGRPLPRSVRNFYEPRFGYDFSKVRIYADSDDAEAARTLNAKAYTHGRDIVFGAGQYAPETRKGRQLLAHELTHVLQQSDGKEVHEKPGRGEKAREQVLYAKCRADPVQCRSGKEGIAVLHLQRALGSPTVHRLLGERIQRDPPEQATPTEADYRAVVEGNIRLFTMAAGRYRLSPVSVSRLTFAALFREEWHERSWARGLLAQIGRFLQSLIDTMQRAASPEGLLLEIGRILTEWRRAYDAAMDIISGQLAGNAALAHQLRSSYQAAIEALHRSVRNRTPRVSINLIAAPPAPGDDFIANATAYARSYFASPRQDGDVVQTVEGIASPSALLDTVERARPERMIRRVDIFAHGTINPSNQIRFGPTWYTVADIEAAAQGRQYESRYIQSIARFDERSVMEVHACRLGGGTGQRFLEGTGRAVGGEHGQSVTGYTQRWYPYRFEIFWTWNAGGVQVHNERVVNTQADIYGPNALPNRNGQPGDHNAFVMRFENYAVQVFDDVVAGSLEVRSFLNATEQAGGAVTRARKIEIMRAMYDQNGAWLLGFLHPAAGATPGEARAAEASAAYAFTGETADWQARVLTVRVNPPAPPPGP